MGIMSIVMASRAALQQKLTLFEGKPVALELHDDGRLVLLALDRKTGAVREKLLDVALSEADIRTESSLLIILAPGKKFRVDFAQYRGAAFLAGGIIGMAVSESAAKNSVVAGWVTGLRDRGVSVKVQRPIAPMLYGLLIAIVVLITVLVVVISGVGS
jgi:hypothetical protein